MKVTFVVLGFACFIGALQAFPLAEETEQSNFEAVEQTQPQVLPNFEENDVKSEEEIIQPLVGVRPPQIHDNAVKSQGPLSGRLTNVVFNEKGMQKTVQRNSIQYNVDTIKKILEEALGNKGAK